MPGTTLDTNVILDILLDDPEHAAASERALDEAVDHGVLSIGPVTFAELATAFARRAGPRQAIARLHEFLDEAGIHVADWEGDAAATAGLAYAHHLASRSPEEVQCPKCGERKRYRCSSCKGVVAWRNHIVTDFLIGAHALHSTGRILTRDVHLHERIPGLEVLVPGSRAAPRRRPRRR